MFSSHPREARCNVMGVSLILMFPLQRASLVLIGGSLELMFAISLCESLILIFVFSIALLVLQGG